MFFTLVVVYPAFHFWSHQRLTIVDNSKRLAWDYFWFACYVFYIGMLIVCFSTSVKTYFNIVWKIFWLGRGFKNLPRFLGAAIWIPLKETLAHNLPPASAVTLLMEQVRLVMKTHAFVRSNVPVALFYFNKRQTRVEDITEDVKDDADQAPCPDFSKYLYFMFAPTLVYRNRYPRSCLFFCCFFYLLKI